MIPSRSSKVRRSPLLIVLLSPFPRNPPFQSAPLSGQEKKPLQALPSLTRAGQSLHQISESTAEPSEGGLVAGQKPRGSWAPGESHGPLRCPEGLPSEQSQESSLRLQIPADFLSSLTPFSHVLSAQTLFHLSCCLQIQFLCCCQDPSLHSLSRLPVTQPAFPKSFYNYLREPLFQEDRQSCRDEGLWEGTEPSQPLC